MRNDTLQLSPRSITVYQVNSYSKIVSLDVELRTYCDKRVVCHNMYATLHLAVKLNNISILFCILS